MRGRLMCLIMVWMGGSNAVKWSSLPPFGAVWSILTAQLEPVFGGFLRVWRIGGKPAVPLVCAGAGVRGWLCISLHSSILSKRVRRMGNKLLSGLGFSGVRQMEARMIGEMVAWR